MKEQFKEAEQLISDIVHDHIFDQEEINGECEEREEILEALNLLIDLAEKALKD